MDALWKRTTTIVFAVLVGCALSATLLVSTGCQAAGAVITTYDRTRMVEIEAEYSGLVSKKVAVLIDAPIEIQYEHAGVVPVLTELISLAIAGRVQNAQVLYTREIIQFQNNNVYWPMMDYAELAQELQAERLVLIDLIEYRLFEPGNSYYWDGRAIADVHVFEAESLDSTQFAFTQRVTARFPSVDAVGRDKAMASDVQLGLQAEFANRVVWLFHSYERQKQDIIDEERREQR